MAMRAGEDSQGGAAFVSGVTQLSALLEPTSLVSFLFGDKKVTPNTEQADYLVLLNPYGRL